VSIVHEYLKGGDAPAPPRLHTSHAQVIGGVAVVQDDTIIGGDILLHIQDSEMWNSWRGDYRSTVFTYYLVKNVSRPSGICSGHVLLTLQELA
jgi:hypothetical protein